MRRGSFSFATKPPYCRTRNQSKPVSIRLFRPSFREERTRAVRVSDERGRSFAGRRNMAGVLHAPSISFAGPPSMNYLVTNRSLCVKPRSSGLTLFVRSLVWFEMCPYRVCGSAQSVSPAAGHQQAQQQHPGTRWFRHRGEESGNARARAE